MNETNVIKPVNSENAISSEIQTTYKDSPLGKIPVDWEVTTLGKEIEDLEAGVSVNSTDENIIVTDLCILKTSSISGGKFIPYECKKISQKDIPRAKLNPQKDSIIISRMNTPDLVGECGYVSESYDNLFLPDRLWQTKFPHASKIEVKWLNYVLNTTDYKLKIKNVATGTSNSMKNISKSSFLSLKIPLPPQTEQRAIATCLSTIDETITKTNQLIAQKELRKKWLMQQLLSGKKRLKGFGREWKEVRLDDIFNRVTRKNDEVNTNVVTISAQRGFVRQTDFFNKSIASEILDNYFLVEKGEFCYNKSYSNGYPWGATKRLNDFEKAVVTTLYICFGIRNEKETSGDFFEQYFEANLLDKGLTKIAHEGGRAHGLLNVTPNDFFSLKINIPEFEEQTAIAQVLQAADKEIQLLKAKAEKLKEEKKGMMQVLLTGKKRLNLDSPD
jgi:type I restriction enzyme, S subunit